MGGCPVVDVFSPDFVRDPYPVYRELQEAGPVQQDIGTGLWLVSRYADVRRILLRPEIFRPDNTLDAVARLSVPALRHLAAVGFTLPPTLANNGGASHAGLRSVVSRLLSGARVSATVGLATDLVTRQLDRVEAKLARHGGCDLVATLTRDLPFAVMLHVLGIEADVDLDALARWNDASLELFWGRPERARQPRLARLAAEFYQWLRGLAERADATAPGLLGRLAAHRLPDGRALSRVDIIAVCYFMVIAGQATTAQMLATMLLRALDDPQVWSRLGRDCGFAAAWAEEMLRREPPLTAWRRRLARPVLLDGAELPDKAELLLLLASTGSDPRVFASPQRLDPHRPGGRAHLSFGVGLHRCPGAALARMEARVVLHAVAARFPGLRLARPAEEIPMFGLLSFRAPKAVPVSLDGRR
jgi:cytochrome P450